MNSISRPSGRQANQLRQIKLQRNYTKHAEGSVFIGYGDTHVLCNASVIPGVPRFLKGSNQGWITAEYGMLPRATHTRVAREAAAGKQGGRTQEIQRLIGRVLRQCVDLSAVGDYTITLDCDVLQADGGTRTAAITGACIALVDALTRMQEKKLISKNPLRSRIAAVSVGIVRGEAVLDLDYLEDSNADSDMNLVMNEAGAFIEIQGTAERSAFTPAELQSLLSLGHTGITYLLEQQRLALGL